MKYRLNALPVKTTNGFHINDVEIDLDIEKYHYEHEGVIKGDLSKVMIEKSMKEESLSSKIGLSVKKYCNIKITIPKNVQMNQPIFLTYDFCKEDVFYSKIQFVYEENASCDFILSYQSQDQMKHFNYLVENVISHKNSKGNITVINTLNSHSMMFYALENDVLEKASITHTIIDLGGKVRLYNASSYLKEKDASNSLHTIYIGQKNELLDFNYYLKNLASNTQNQMRVEGALEDKSQKNFRGTIDFIKGCSHSVGEENENCVLLSDTCMSRSLPQMLCEEEDVIGIHGVSSGKVDEEKLFYLMSRGFSQKEAEKFIILGNFMSIINEIPSNDVRESLVHRIEDLLS